MKKNYIFKFILLLIPVSAFTLLSFSSGNPNALSGSPGDSGNNCTQCHSGTANNSNITITEVNVSPDLKNAKVYIMPLGGKHQLEVLEGLNKVKGHIKKIISSGITLRQIPKISFKIDNSFEYAAHIDLILHKIKK